MGRLEESRYRRRHRRVALIFFGIAACMVGLSFAAVPLYRLFCAATGYGGTIQVAHVAPSAPGKRVLTVRFDANVAPGLPWQFAPETPSVSLRTGETKTVFYKVTNTADRPISAVAAYNVSPDQAGGYFDKLACFCFSEQTLNAHETAEWPVVFFLDPALEQDGTMKDVGAITLSYTFFASKNAPGKAPDKAPDKAPPRSADNRMRPGT
jgi:cytochrome c oxidase assembly protein subunit 11